jgi:hypothetical protein
VKQKELGRKKGVDFRERGEIGKLSTMIKCYTMITNSTSFYDEREREREKIFSFPSMASIFNPFCSPHVINELRNCLRASDL